MRKNVIVSWMMTAAALACGCSRGGGGDGAGAPATAEPAASASVSAADSHADCAATTLDGVAIASGPAPVDGRGATDYGACRTALEPQIRAVVCNGSGPPAFMFRMGSLAPVKVPIVCSAAPVTASATTAPAHPAHGATTALAHPADVRPGGVGTCSATRLDGSLIAVEAAPSTGISHDYVACRAKIEPKIKAALCDGKTGTVSYFYKISSNPPVKSPMLCR